jgi:LysM repeat protein
MMTAITHVVQAGETFATIAEKYGTTIETLVEYNGITDPELLFEGQTLLIPVEFSEEPIEEEVAEATEAPTEEMEEPALEPTEGEEEGDAVVRTYMGPITRGTMRGTLRPGEEHVYTYVAESSGGYNYYAFALIAADGDLDPFLYVHVGNSTFMNDNSYLAEEYPGAARVPPDSAFCTEPSQHSYEVPFEIIVRDARGTGEGDYELDLVYINSRASGEGCSQIFRNDN